jgi:methionyl-tRNA formyltransferase
MNILIYTSNNKGAFNSYNISRLIHERPNHEYSFIVVNHKINKIRLWLKFKRFIITLRDGRDTFLSDSKVLDNLIYKKIINFENFEMHHVNSVNDSENEYLIKKLNPDVILQAGAGILKKNIFSLAKKATINVHHGLAPEVRGMNSTFWCLYYGLTDLIGVTCHIIDENLDTGDIITQFKYKYTKGDSFIKIQKNLCQEGAELLIEAIDILEQNVNFKKESKEVLSYYFSSISRLDYRKLKNNNFESVARNKINDLKTKKKQKTKIKP